MGYKYASYVFPRNSSRNYTILRTLQGRSRPFVQDCRSPGFYGNLRFWKITNNPISIRCVRLCPSHYYLPPKFSDLPRAPSCRVRPSVRLSVLPCLCPSSSSHRLVSGTILCNEKEASLTSVRPRKQAEAAILLASPTMKVFRLKPGDFPFYKQVSRYVLGSVAYVR